MKNSMDKDRMEAKERVKNLPFGAKVKHYLYYYKFHLIIILTAALMLGVYIYQRALNVEPDLEISVFTKDYITAEAEKNAEKIISEWINKENGKDDLTADINVTSVAAFDEGDADRLSAAYTKLDGQLAAGTVFALILDGETYETVMSLNEYSSVMFDEFSGEIGENAKMKLGLGSDEKYYYVTRILYSNEQDDAEAIAKQEYAMQIYMKIEELN